MLKGIDVSNWQGTIDWDAVKADGISFAIAKATEGTNFVDPFFARNWSEMKRVGIMRGAYHYARPALNAANSEADFFYGAVSAQGIEKGDILVLDMEEHDSDACGWALFWLEHLDDTTPYRPMLYTSPSYIAKYEMAENPPFFGYPLWLASWGAIFPDPPDTFWPVDIWQSASDGKVAGIRGNVDIDWYDGSEEEFKQLSQQDEPPEDDDPWGEHDEANEHTFAVMPTLTWVSNSLEEMLAHCVDVALVDPDENQRREAARLWAREFLDRRPTWDKDG